MSSFTDKPSAPEESCVNWDNSPAILNKQRIEALSKFHTTVKNYITKYSTKCNKTHTTLQVMKALEMTCFSIETPIVGTSIFVPIIAPFTVPILLGTTVLHLIFKSIGNRVSKDLLVYSSNNILANQTLEQLQEAIEKASDDGIVTEDEFNQVHRLYKRFFNSLQ
jgi:hypothetical protein